jgi:ABC-type transport system involved in multi-copper enzyme maturation permease subunit
MLQQLKAEWRKLTTTRSTYVILGLSLALVIFYSFYVVGYRGSGGAGASTTHGVISVVGSDYLASQVFQALQVVGIFSAIIAVLLASHEYRYNTITYTLTLSNSRTKVLLAKLFVVLGLGAVYATAVGILTPTMAALGLHAHHAAMVPQVFHVGDLLWRSAFYGAGYAAIALIITLLLRNQVAAIVFLFLYPGTVEQLIGLWLKPDKGYLPFMSLAGVIGGNGTDTKFLSPAHSALVFLAYLVSLLVVAWTMFVKRDAN